MAELTQKIKSALMEGRMLIMGSQVLLGIQFRSIFEKSFGQQPDPARWARLAGLGLMILTLALLLAPAPYHRIVENGNDTNRLHRFASRVMDCALFPFALALGLEASVATITMCSAGWSVAYGAATCLVAFGFWYGLEFYARRKRGISRKQRWEMNKREHEKAPPTAMKDKIDHVLTEARCVLPGAQALLGFQFATMLLEHFEQLPQGMKYLHLASLSLVMLSIIFLMTPAAYHRLVEAGEETEHFYFFSARMVLLAMVPFALGVCGDLYLVVHTVTRSSALSLVASVAMLVLCYGLWFGLTFYKRYCKRAEEKV